MNPKKDRSMYYAAFISFILFILLVGWVVAHIDLESSAGPAYALFPDGYQIIEKRDSHGGFHGDGVAFLAVQIPEESSQDFARLLQEENFTDSELPEPIQSQLRTDSETCMASDILNAFWLFEDESPEGNHGMYTNYILHIYDLDTGIYYYMEYDS